MPESRSSEQMLAEFQTDGAAVQKERLPKDVRLRGTSSSGADDDRSDRVLLRVVMWRLRYSGTMLNKCLYQFL